MCTEAACVWATPSAQALPPQPNPRPKRQGSAASFNSYISPLDRAAQHSSDNSSSALSGDSLKYSGSAPSSQSASGYNFYQVSGSSYVMHACLRAGCCSQEPDAGDTCGHHALEIVHGVRGMQRRSCSIEGLLACCWSCLMMRTSSGGRQRDGEAVSEGPKQQWSAFVCAVRSRIAC